MTDDETLRTRIGAAVRQIRKEQNLTGAELSTRLERSQASISQVESGAGIDSILGMRRYEDALGVPHGSILLRAGLIEHASDVAGAIKADTLLQPDQKAFLLKAYTLCLS